MTKVTETEQKFEKKGGWRVIEGKRLTRRGCLSGDHLRLSIATRHHRQSSFADSQINLEVEKSHIAALQLVSFNFTWTLPVWFCGLDLHNALPLTIWYWSGLILNFFLNGLLSGSHLPLFHPPLQPLPPLQLVLGGYWMFWRSLARVVIPPRWVLTPPLI